MNEHREVLRTFMRRFLRYVRLSEPQTVHRATVLRGSVRRQRRIERRRAKQTVPQEKDRWPADWKPLTIEELFDR